MKRIIKDIHMLCKQVRCQKNSKSFLYSNGSIEMKGRLLRTCIRRLRLLHLLESKEAEYNSRKKWNGSADHFDFMTQDLHYWKDQISKWLWRLKAILCKKYIPSSLNLKYFLIYNTSEHKLFNRWEVFLMRIYTILRLMFALFLLYVAWPFISLATTQEAKLFWMAWLGMLFLVVGSNLATLLHMSDPPVMEQLEEIKQKRGRR